MTAAASETGVRGGASGSSVWKSKSAIRLI